MKRYLLLIILFFNISVYCKAENIPDINAKAAVLIDAETGKILYSKNSLVPLQPASLTKMLTGYLVLNAIRNNDIKWGQKVSVSNYAHRISRDWRLSDFKLDKNITYSVRELFEAMVIYSANSAAIALAELVSGSETEFVREMNKKAGELGLKKYKFYDCTGLSNAGMLLECNYTEGGNRFSAADAALLAFRLIKDFPEILAVSSIGSKNFYYDSYNFIKMVNRNWMLPGGSFAYSGIDGLKTGHTGSAGYCFTATAERSGVRLISVVMKACSRKECFAETRKILDYGFNSFNMVQMAPAGYETAVSVHNGEKYKVRIFTKKPLRGFIKKGEEKKYELICSFKKYCSYNSDTLKTPLKKNQHVGFLCLKYAGDESGEYILSILSEGQKNERAELFAAEDMNRVGWFALIKRKLAELLKQ